MSYFLSEIHFWILAKVTLKCLSDNTERFAKFWFGCLSTWYFYKKNLKMVKWGIFGWLAQGIWLKITWPPGHWVLNFLKYTLSLSKIQFYSPANDYVLTIWHDEISNWSFVWFVFYRLSPEIVICWAKFG